MDAVVVVGASQGGVQATRTLIAGLPPAFPAPVVVVLHVGANRSILPSLLNELGSLRASHARNGDRLTPGHVHVAPPDHHLLIVDGILELSRGPRENWARPAVDPLFRSAAEAYGPGVIGVVLTGRLNDGTAGLYEIKRRGGVAIVQDPVDAEMRDMPESALRNVKVDYVLPVRRVPTLLVELVERTARRHRRATATGVQAVDQDTPMAEPVAQTCPECGGAMRAETLGTLTQFRCHIGHVMTAEVLAAAHADQLEQHASALLRNLNERAALCHDIAAKHLAAGDETRSQQWRRAADEAQERETQIKKIAAWKWSHPEMAAAPSP
jgi:two-component system chemotaxis response regulator CheB